MVARSPVVAVVFLTLLPACPAEFCSNRVALREELTLGEGASTTAVYDLRGSTRWSMSAALSASGPAELRIALRRGDARDERVLRLRGGREVADLVTTDCSGDCFSDPGSIEWEHLSGAAVSVDAEFALSTEQCDGYALRLERR